MMVVLHGSHHMLTFDSQLLDKYAELAIRVGVNLQPDQRLLIGPVASGSLGTPIEAAPLVRALTKHAYMAGAKDVNVIWTDRELTRLRLQYGSSAALEELPHWPIQATLAHMEAGEAVLLINAHDPDLFADEDSTALNRLYSALVEGTAAAAAHISRGTMNWSLLCASVAGWASKVFPDLLPLEADARLWDVIFDVCRVKSDDPMAAWRRHIDTLVSRADHLNARSYRELHYRGPGTDLRVGLPDAHRWHAPRLRAKNGISAVVNLPTEEVYTLPHRDRVEGTVTSTKPLVLPQDVIEGFTLTFKKGRVIHHTATNGEAALLTELDMDEGARALGEIALVPHSSPISQTGLLFYSTILDENASSHLALGDAFRNTLAGGMEMSDAEFSAAGGNRSIMHLDFMIGSGEMNIEGITKNGAVEPIMRGGEWAFD